MHMQSIATELEIFLDRHTTALASLTENEMAQKPSPAKWSKKEMIGHLIDSAENNIRRFVVAQYEEIPVIKYNQDKWVAIANYQQWNKGDLINLWYLLNKQVCEILKNTSAETALRTCQTGELHTIEWLAVDYIKHLRHHIHQVLDLEPVPYP
jgi:DinB superfamily